MPYSVLIVDDSSFFQVRLKEIVNEHPDLQVVGIAANGQEAIDMEEELRPDIISMDYEMPYLDGVSAVKTILSKRRIPIVMFSSMTYEGARITLEALDAGAVDFVPKNFAEVSRDSAKLKKKLNDKLLYFARSSKPRVPGATSEVKPSASTAPKSLEQQKTTGDATVASAPHRQFIEKRPLSNAPAGEQKPQGTAKSPRRNFKGQLKLLAIGASTGGPVALSEIITKLPANFPVPIVVVQHMPENFTAAFAERLNKQSALRVKEAATGDLVERGTVLIAPGGHQMMLDRTGRTVKILPGDDRLSYKPSVDITFGSAANSFGDAVLALILTGMGSDGCEGARLLKGKGAAVWAQDESTSVVYGMPAAVASAELADEILPIDQVARKLVEDV